VILLVVKSSAIWYFVSNRSGSSCICRLELPEPTQAFAMSASKGSGRKKKTQYQGRSSIMQEVEDRIERKRHIATVLKIERNLTGDKKDFLLTLQHEDKSTRTHGASTELRCS